MHFLDQPSQARTTRSGAFTPYFTLWVSCVLVFVFVLLVIVSLFGWGVSECWAKLFIISISDISRLGPELQSALCPFGGHFRRVRLMFIYSMQRCSDWYSCRIYFSCRVYHSLSPSHHSIRNAANIGKVSVWVSSDLVSTFLIHYWSSE